MLTLILFLSACAEDPAIVADSATACHRAIEKRFTTLPLDECVDTLAMLRSSESGDVVPCMTGWESPRFCRSLENGDVHVYGRTGTMGHIIKAEDGMDIAVFF